WLQRHGQGSGVRRRDPEAEDRSRSRARRGAADYCRQAAQRVRCGARARAQDPRALAFFHPLPWGEGEKAQCDGPAPGERAYSQAIRVKSCLPSRSIACAKPRSGTEYSTRSSTATGPIARVRSRKWKITSLRRLARTEKSPPKPPLTDTVLGGSPTARPRLARQSRKALTVRPCVSCASSSAMAALRKSATLGPTPGIPAKVR